MLLGETGTGKEFQAEIIHHNGPWAAGPLIGVNCTAIPKEWYPLSRWDRRFGSVDVGKISAGDSGAFFPETRRYRRSWSKYSPDYGFSVPIWSWMRSFLDCLSVRRRYSFFSFHKKSRSAGPSHDGGGSASRLR